MSASLIAAILLSSFLAPAQAPAPDAEGFIRNWLVLAPIPIQGDSGAAAIEVEFLEGEAKVAPRAGETVKVGSQALTWTAHQTSDYFIDFLEAFGKAQGEYVVGYAVAYINADAPMDVTLALSTNDQGKAWLNGKEVFSFLETRVLEKDTDRIPVSLVKGQNVLVLKVINEVNNWQACARFVKDGAPVKNLEVALAPR